jgi:hypothetical protein
MNFTKDETIQRILNDPDAMTSSIMINPEAIGEMSPTLPSEFPKNLIPLEICEQQLLKLSACLIDAKFDNVACESNQLAFYECKKWRDSLLFKRIKEWEESYVNSLGEDLILRNLYVDNLRTKKQELINLYEKIDTVSKNRAKRKKVEYDIIQLDWRIKYLKESLNLQNKISI